MSRVARRSGDARRGTPPRASRRRNRGRRRCSPPPPTSVAAPSSNRRRPSERSAARDARRLRHRPRQVIERLGLGIPRATPAPACSTAATTTPAAPNRTSRSSISSQSFAWTSNAPPGAPRTASTRPGPRPALAPARRRRAAPARSRPEPPPGWRAGVPPSRARPRWAGRRPACRGRRRCPPRQSSSGATTPGSAPTSAPNAAASRRFGRRRRTLHNG